MKSIKICKWLLFVFAFLYPGFLLAQKTLYLKPFIGRQTPICRFDKNYDNPGDVTVKPLSMTWSPGVFLEINLNENWIVISGIEKGVVGWHFTRENPDGNFSNEPEGSSTFHPALHLPFQIQRRLASVTALNLNSDKENYLLNFDLYVRAGLSYNIIPRRDGQTDTIYLGRYVFNGQSELDFSRHKFIRKKSASIYIGIGTQFYHRNNPRFDFTIFYSQGLLDVQIVELNYRQGKERKTAKLRTRGSVIGATLAYPIRLKTFERKRF